MEVRAAPNFTLSLDAFFATCRIVVSYDWSSTRYFLPDHLNSTNVVTDASGTPIQTLDYYPYGSTRINQTTNNFNEQKQFIARYSDPETNLSYLQARYYDGSKGEFLSEDPVFWGDPAQQNLSNPQSLNSYSYGNDNPITNKDPDGRYSEALAAIGGTAVVLVAVYPFLPPKQQQAVGRAIAALGLLVQSIARGGGGSIVANPYPAGVRSTPYINTNVTINTVPWANINFSAKKDNDQYGPLPTPAELTGKTPEQIDQIMKDKGIQGQPSRGGGTRYPVPGRPGDQVRIEPGNQKNSDPMKQGPYGKVSQDGKESEHFPLDGNPTLGQ